MIAPNFENRFVGRDLSVFDHNRTQPRLRWYEFKEGFSSSLVKEAVLESRANRPTLSVLDPFAGSGTTLVSAAALGNKVTGIEVNPFLAFASAAKCHPGAWSRRSFDRTTSQLFDTGPFEKPSKLEGFSTFCEQEGRDKWLFNRSVVRGFQALSAKISARMPAWRPMRLALLGAAMDCCNARRDGKCLRYIRDWRQRGFSSKELRERFAARLEHVREDLVASPVLPGSCTAIHGDARRVLKQLRKESYDLIVTSPPYLNSFDYSDVYRPEMFLGGFVRDNTELRAVRLRTLRSHVQVDWERPRTIASAMLVPILRDLSTREGLWDRRLPLMVQAYFEDMEGILAGSWRAAKPGAQAWIVVSTSAYGGIEIPVDLVLADIAVRKGWKLRSVNVLRGLRAAGQHWNYLAPGARPPLRESLLILDKPRRA